ncbi:anaerobic ribonucleoside-triphosphate reductase [Acetonema longum]|uniref:Uncharacterized protein n=1 Tax=Acetonema longum DSM 6540 TaxID=1009370 RepID=F7NL16_9FIRM|nr:anaerobic ribonucleoside-triphosphate reductase [Acetonema longum]EGO63272.1 hypothetical protein ALO_13942 [Acetonema longum DSM 6540]
MTIDGITVCADSGLTSEEIARLVSDEKSLWQQRGKTLAQVDITLEGTQITVTSMEKSPIRRIRRITGYLSSIDNFNDAKRAECQDRVVHAS